VVGETPSLLQAIHMNPKMEAMINFFMTVEFVC